MNHDASTIPAWSDLTEDADDESLSTLAAQLARLDGPVDALGDWPESLWAVLAAQGVPRWSMPPEFGGEGCDRVTLLNRYARVAEGSLTAAFILSQHDAGVRRLAAAADRMVAREWLVKIAAGQAFTTVGISHLTTSRRLGPQAMAAVPSGGGYVLDGVLPWVTAAVTADFLVAGASLADGRQILVALPTDRSGVEVAAPFPLAALQASCTSEVACTRVVVDEFDLLAGPDLDVVSHTGAAGTGGLETSALALGQARAAIVALGAEAPSRADLVEPIGALVDAWRSAWGDLLAAARGVPDGPTPAQVRGKANALVLRATQAYLTARKGSGFLRTEPAQRWARQALFFLVWSCPSPVAQAAIRDLAGLCPA